MFSLLWFLFLSSLSIDQDSFFCLRIIKLTYHFWISYAHLSVFAESSPSLHLSLVSSPPSLQLRSNITSIKLRVLRHSKLGLANFKVFPWAPRISMSSVKRQRCLCIWLLLWSHWNLFFWDWQVWRWFLCRRLATGTGTRGKGRSGYDRVMDSGNLE